MGAFANIRACAGARLTLGILLFGILLLGIPILGLLFAASAIARADSSCAGAETTVDMRACLDKAYERADAELNVVWKKVTASIAVADTMPAKERNTWKEELLASQRAWITFKESDCDALGFEWWGGTGASCAILNCLLAHTTARTKDLKARYIDN